MENARALNERLRHIIKEVSSDTGDEIKKELSDELLKNIENIVKEQSNMQIYNLLKSLHKAIKYT